MSAPGSSNVWGELAKVLGITGSPVSTSTGAAQPVPGDPPGGAGASGRTDWNRLASDALGRTRAVNDQLGALKPPSPTPALSGKDMWAPALAGLAGLLLKAPINEIVAGFNGYIDSRQRAAGMKDAAARTAYEDQRAALGQRSALELKGAQFASQQALQAERAARAEEDRNMTAVDRAKRRYQTASSEIEKGLAAAEWRRVEPGTAPNADQVTKDSEAFRVSALAQARGLWEKLLHSHLTPFGEVDPAWAAQLEPVRKGLVDRFGAGDSVHFSEIPTADSRLRASTADIRTEVERYFGTRGDGFKRAVSTLLARMTLAKDRARVAEQAGLGKSGLNLNAKGHRSEARGAAKSLADALRVEINGVRKQLALTMRPSPLRVSPSAGAQSQSQRRQVLATELGHLQDLLRSAEAEIAAPLNAGVRLKPKPRPTAAPRTLPKLPRPRP